MELQDAALSSYGHASAEPSPVSRMMAAFAADFRDGVDINLGVGYVNERTIPDRRVLEALEHILNHPGQYRQPLNYGGPQGSANLIAAIQAFYVRQGIGGLSPDLLNTKQIMIGPCGATSILDALTEVLTPGIVVTSDPMYYIYCNALRRKGFEILTVPEDSDGIQTDALRERLEALGDGRVRISFFYIVTVNNPTSSILSNARRRELVEMASVLSRELGRKVPLLFDQAYEFLIHDPAAPKPESGLLHDDLGLAYELGTLSKILAPALRIGYCIGPPGALMDALIQKTSDVGFSAPLFAQEIAAHLIEVHAAEQIASVNAGYREKARAVRAAIDGCLGDAVESLSGGRAGFYYYLTFKEIETTETSPFFRFLARTTGDPAIDGPPENKAPRVIYIPGEHCVHPEGALAERGRRQLRISYGFEEPERIAEALGHMQAAVAYAKKHAG